MSSFLPTINRRTRPTGPLNKFRYRTSGSASWNDRVFQGDVTEEIISQCHTGTWPPPVGSRRDIGGPMRLHRVWDSFPETATIQAGLTQGTVGMSSMIGYVYGQDFATLATGVDMNLFGTSAIAQVLPTNPSSSLSTALGELKKDGLPSLPGSSMRDRTDLARRSGNEFLNIEFGWLPLVRDVQDFARTVKNSRRLIDQYLRDSDQKIRRRFVPRPLDLGTEVHTGPGRVLGQNIVCPNSTVTKSTLTQYSFSGAFRYHVPVDDGFYGRLRRWESLSARLFDTRVTPELIWNLAPWSWAVDWFTNAGDVIHNISRLGADGLVMQYGYAMRHSRVEEYHRGTFSFGDLVGTHSGTVARHIGSEWKQRIRAHPYGFGIDDLSLNAIQLAILAALGLTRGQRTD